jgi:tetratricopeptide (TPR) repeat protein
VSRGPRAWFATGALAAAGCASALHEPRPIDRLAPHHANGRSAEELARAGDAAWAQRATAGQAAAAQDLYLDAAALDDTHAAPVLGAMAAMSYRIEREPGAPRGTLAAEEVELGQWCQRRAPAEPACDYRLAIALGQQARERHATGKDALHIMVDLLHKAAKAQPALDDAGPHRVLALVLLRAPAWPVGPGDPEAALGEAKAAVALAPDAAVNQLALGDTLAANGEEDGARDAYRRARDLARAAKDPEAPRWLADAETGLTKLGG